MEYRIRAVQETDLEAVAHVEAECFPAAEAAAKEDLSMRIRTCAESFFVAETPKGEIIGFINGCCSDSDHLEDAFYHDASLHQPSGIFQMIFGLNVLPEYRKHGLGEMLMRYMIESASHRGKKAVILTCKEHMVSFYARIGYRFEGVSDSVHGGAVWYCMRYDLEKKKYWHDHKVQYYETDQMGIVHHSNYIRWFEEARLAFLEELNIGYAELEKKGIISPVVSVEAKYKHMCHLEDEVRIIPVVQKYDGICLEFSYQIINRSNGTVACEGKSSHCFVDENGRLVTLKKYSPEVHQRLCETLKNN